jgi:hypothetical protein
MTTRLILILLVAVVLIAFFYKDPIAAWLDKLNNPNPNDSKESKENTKE